HLAEGHKRARAQIVLQPLPLQLEFRHPKSLLSPNHRATWSGAGRAARAPVPLARPSPKILGIRDCAAKIPSTTLKVQPTRDLDKPHRRASRATPSLADRFARRYHAFVAHSALPWSSRFQARSALARRRANHDNHNIILYGPLFRLGQLWLG